MRRVTITLLCLASILNLLAEDRFYIEDFNISPGETKQVSIMLDNATEYTALQADIMLPEGLTVAMEDDEYVFDLTERKTRTHTVSSNQLSSGAIRILIASPRKSVFSGDSGALVTFDIIADAGLAGSRVITVSNVIASETNSTTHSLPDASCTVTVVHRATSISLDKAAAQVVEGGTLQLTATVLPENATDRTVSWNSSDESVATVDANGLVTAVAPGTVTITATTADGTGLTATSAVTVLDFSEPHQGLKLSEKVFRLQLGQSRQVQVLTQGVENVIWSSSDASIASVDANGVVTAHKNGIAIITATAANGAAMWCGAVCNLPGDLNGSDNVDVQDVNQLINIVLGKTTNQ